MATAARTVSGTNLAFRPMQESDFGPVAALAEAIWRVSYRDILSDAQIGYMLEMMYSPDSLRRQMNNGCTYTLAHESGALVGYASVERQEQAHFIHKFYVDAARQRAGLGTTLLDELQRLHRPAQLRLHVNRDNFKAINFYFRRGFVITGRKDSPIGGGFVMEDFVMEKQVL